jgi:U3 small nucleolar RNA-associated protein 14
MKGKKHTEESKKKMSEAHKGRSVWNKGLVGAQTHSEETRQKLSEIGKGNKSRTGQKQSEEEKRKKSESLKKYYAERRSQGYKR